VGLDPDSWQLDVLRSQASRILLNCSRQSGKSTVTALLAVHTAHYQNDALVMLLSPTLRQSGELFKKALKTSRAWMIKELGMKMWEAGSCGDAKKIFGAFYCWAIRSRLEPIKRAARTIKNHLVGILNAIEFRITNARLEGINTVIQGLKRAARGFRNRQRFRNATYFHLGGLDLYPESLTHSSS